MSNSPTDSPFTTTTAIATRPKKYTIFVRDEEFVLYQSQLEFDAPNYFTAIFLGDFSESRSTTTVYFDRNPDLFAIIMEYMSGYTVLPLAERALPRTMDMQTTLRNLAEDAAFYGLSRLHAQLTTPRQPNIDFAWTGFSGRVVRFEDVLQGNFPESVSYTTSGLCSFDCGDVKPVIIYARDLALKLVGNRDLDKNGRPDLNDTTVSYRLVLSPSTKDQLVRQPYSAFEFCEAEPTALVVSVFPDSQLHIDSKRLRFEHFAHWWRMRRAPAFVSASARADEREAERVFDDAFPSPFEESPARGEWCERNEFALWGDDLLFIITARGFIAGTLQLHVKLLDVRARTRAAVIETLRPLVNSSTMDTH